MSQKFKSINLLEPIGVPDDTWTVMYKWVFNVGRYVILVVEILVLAVFFSRFILDKQNNDLTEDINNKVEILSNKEYRSDEVKYRNIQKLLSDYRNITQQQKINSEIVASTISAIPSGLVLQAYSFDTDKISITVEAINLAVIKDYEFALKQNPEYTNVILNINRVESGSGLYKANISYNISSRLSKK